MNYQIYCSIYQNSTLSYVLSTLLFISILIASFYLSTMPLYISIFILFTVGLIVISKATYHLICMHFIKIIANAIQIYSFIHEINPQIHLLHSLLNMIIKLNYLMSF